MKAQMMEARLCSWISRINIMKMAPLLKMTCSFSVIPMKSQYHFAQNKTKSTIHVEAQEIPSGQSSFEESDTANIPGLDSKLC